MNIILKIVMKPYMKEFKGVVNYEKSFCIKKNGKY